MNRQEALLQACAALKASNVADAYAEAEVLLAHCLGVSRAELYASLDASLAAGQLQSCRDLVRRRAAGEPSAYITGRREFFGLDFHVDRRVLIPRPETELLVEKALELAGGLPLSQRGTKGDFPLSQRGTKGDSPLSQRGTKGDFPLLIADIGTGSGAIAVSLAVHLPRARVYATDISPAALEVARFNCEKYGVTERVTLLCGDLLGPLPEPVDLIVANLPYIPTPVYLSLEMSVKDHEPELALHGGATGLDLISRILEQAPSRLRPGGSLLLEIAAGQAAEVVAAAESVFPGARKTVFQDLAGLDRAVLIETKP